MERANELRRLAATPGLPPALVAHLAELATAATVAPELTELARRLLSARRTVREALAGS